MTAFDAILAALLAEGARAIEARERDPHVARCACGALAAWGARCAPCAARASRGTGATAPIPATYAWAERDPDALARLVGSRAVERARESAAAGRGLLLTGPTGAGKSSLAAMALARSASVAWAHAAELGAAVASHPLGAGDPPLVRALLRATVAVVDDVDAGDRRGLEVARRVVHMRYDAARPTWATATVDAHDDLALQALGGDVVRRLVERGGLLQLGGGAR